MTVNKKRFHLLCLAIFFCTTPPWKRRVSHAQGEESSESSKRDDWYKRYSVYPPYCATPQEMAKRKIPPLKTDDSRPGQTKIVHATVLIRHGARTPTSSKMNCWENYTTSDTGVWNCDLTTILAPPSPKRIDQEEQDSKDAGQATQAMFLFEKNYDALLSPSFNLSNALNGTCQLGQLLLQGYEQELKNGEYLRAAYVYSNGNDDDSNHDHAATMRLIDATKGGQRHAWDPTNLFYRVDDDQRTLMSGQVLLRGMLGPEIRSYFDDNKVYPVLPLHTADRPRDVLDPNEGLCPRLQEIRERFQRSSTFRSFNESQEANTLRAFQRNVLKINGEMHAIDCLMTTICTDRTLPDAVNDYTGGGDRKRRLQDDGQAPSSSQDGGDNDNDDNNNKNISYGTNLFQRLYDFQVQQYSLLVKNNDAEYAKQGMGPLWAEIIPNMQAIIQGKNETCCPKQRPPAKLALFSGHDTTLMPMLATLGPRVFDGEWAHYASMVIVEIHEINLDGKKESHVFPTDHAFRLLYNGKVLTHLLDGCPADSELCDAQVLLDRVAPFATRNRNCTRQYSIPVEYSDTVSRAKDVLSTPGGIIALCLLVIGSALFGSLATYFCVTGNLPRHPRRRRRRGRRRVATTDEDDDDEDGISLQYQQNYGGTYSGVPDHGTALT